MALSKTNKTLDNTLRKLNKRLTDGVGMYGFATEFSQDMAAVMLTSAMSIRDDLRKKGLNVDILYPGMQKKPGVTYIMEIKERFGTRDIIETPMFIRSDILNKADASVLQNAIKKIESVGTIGKHVKSAEKAVVASGIKRKDPNFRRYVAKKLLDRYNSRIVLIQKMYEIYDEAYNDPSHFLHRWIRNMFPLTQANGCQFYEDDINNAYDAFRGEHETLPYEFYDQFSNRVHRRT